MSPSKRGLVVFFTGGTIEMAPRPDAPGVVPGDEACSLLEELPPIPGVSLRPVKWSSLPSVHMSPERMLALARDIDAALAPEDVAGCVVLHGTDTLVETSFLLDMAVRSVKPVVTSGAMRHWGELGYDGFRNLHEALLACLALPEGAGVLIQMGDRLFRPAETVKADSLSVMPFEEQWGGCIGRVAGGRVRFGRGGPPRRSRLPFEVRDLSASVPLLGCWPGMDETLVRSVVKAGARGLVLEGFGAGNVPPRAGAAALEAAQGGLPVVLATRCPRGEVLPIYGYEGGAGRLMAGGVISAGPLSGTKAQLLLKAALGSGFPPAQLFHSLNADGG